MKRGKRLLLTASLATASLVGAYGVLVPTAAQDYAAPKCMCKYPGPPEEYGVLKPVTEPNDGNKYTCEVKKCWLEINAFDSAGGPEN